MVDNTTNNRQHITNHSVKLQTLKGVLNYCFLGGAGGACSIADKEIIPDPGYFLIKS